MMKAENQLFSYSIIQLFNIVGSDGFEPPKAYAS